MFARTCGPILAGQTDPDVGRCPGTPPVTNKDGDLLEIGFESGQQAQIRLTWATFSTKHTHTHTNTHTHTHTHTHTPFCDTTNLVVNERGGCYSVRVGSREFDFNQAIILVVVQPAPSQEVPGIFG